MKTVILFLLTTVLSTGAMLASLSMKNPLIGTAIAFGIIALFFIYLNNTNRNRARQRGR